MKTKLLKIIFVINIITVSVLIGYNVLFNQNDFWFKSSNYQNIQQLSTQDSNKFAFIITKGIEKNYINYKENIIPKINKREGVKFVIVPGNSVVEGTKTKYKALIKQLKLIKVPTFMSVGKTEMEKNGKKEYFKYFGNYYYSFNYGDNYFMFLDSVSSNNVKAQQQWLSKELSNSNKFKNKFVFINDSPIDSKSTKNINKLKEQFAKNKIDYVFVNGAISDTKTVDNVKYISTGNTFNEDNKTDNSGYFVVNVDGEKIDVDYKEEVSALANHRIIDKLSQICAVNQSKILNNIILVCIVINILIFIHFKASKQVNFYNDVNNVNKYSSNKPLKIAMFTNNYLPFIGGVPISIELLSKELRRQGHEVIIFAPQYPENDVEDENVIRIKLLHYFKKWNFKFAVANIFSRGYKEDFKKHNFDVIHVHHPFWLGKSALNLGRKYNIPVIFTYHTRYELYSENVPIAKDLFKNILSHKMIYRFAQKCDGVIAPTNSAKEYLENIRVGTPKIVSMTGIDFSKYQLDRTDALNLKSDANEIILCSVARLSTEKNIDFLIEGIARLTQKTSKKIKCYILGDGPEYERLKNKVIDLDLVDTIIFTGAVCSSEIASYYINSDIFVFASKSETQGMVLLEAMAGKCPVVCVNSSGVDDVVTNGYNGFKTNENLEEWSDKIKMLVEDDELRRRYSLNAYEFSKEYSMEKIAANVARFYEKTIVNNKEKNG